MKISFKRSMSILAVSLALFIQGCGGGGGNGGGNVDIGELPAGKTFKYNRISIAGSSITWGEGYLGEKSYVGGVIKYFREDVADTINPDELPTPSRTINEQMSYMGKLNVYSQGTVISGTIKDSDEVVIVFAGSGISTSVEMEVDGRVCGSHTIKGSFKPVKITTPSNPRDSESGNIRSFRETEPLSVAKICTNLENKEHNFKLTVKSGELHLNFITNHMYYFQNAGIGGYAASTILGEPEEFSHTTTDEVVDFNPDLFIFESSTNDANTWERESQGDRSTNVWRQEIPISYTSDKNKLTLSKVPDKLVKAGDVVIMGTYNGDINTLAVGIVKKDSNTNVIELTEDVPANITKMCKIKSIKTWEDNVEKVIRKVKDGVGHSVVVGIGTSGVPNYFAPNGPNAGNSSFPRRLMGYREKGKLLAYNNGWMFFDFFNKTKAFNPGVEYNLQPSNRWSKGDNTHPGAENGYRLFAEAITDVLKQQ